jgi:hypothetical protein
MIIGCDTFFNEEIKFSTIGFYYVSTFKIHQVRDVLSFFLVQHSWEHIDILGRAFSDILLPSWHGRNMDIFTIVFDQLPAAWLPLL